MYFCRSYRGMLYFTEVYVPLVGVAFLIYDSLCAFLWQSQRLGEIKRETCHIFTTPVPQDLAHCCWNNTITILADLVVKVPFLSARMATRVFSLHFGEMKRENSEHNSVSWHLKKDLDREKTTDLF